MRRPGWLTCGLLLTALVFSTGCGGRKRDPDVERRNEWLRVETDAKKLYLQAVLNGTDDVQFYDGWFNVDHDPTTGGAWRWMERRGIVRLRTKPGGASTVHDMELHVFGWVPYEQLPMRELPIEFAINGHILERFEPPATSFEHVLIVPRRLLENSDWVDFTITVANTARPAGEWRDLGFATTGFNWKPVPPS
jgi:hypothetical protein